MKTKIAILSLLSLLVSVVLPADNIASRNYWPTEGWRLSRAELQGIDAKKLEELSTFIQDELPMTTSVLIVRHGYIVFEYYALDDPEKLREIWSVTKSVLSALTGIAVQRGYIKSIDLPIIGFFPEYSSGAINQKSNAISIRHLMTMSSGITTDENDSDVKPDLFYRNLRNDPGVEFFYNNLGAQLLSMVLTKTTSLSAHDFAKKQLFEPLGISSTEWSARRVGENSYSEGGYGLRMTTRDLAKFGYLYLNNGIWDKKELVPSDWIRNSTSRQIDVPESLWYFMREYGLFWWIRHNKTYASFTGMGWQGQYLYVIPDLDIVAAITALDADNESLYLQIIDNYVVPSVIE